MRFERKRRLWGETDEEKGWEGECFYCYIDSFSLFIYLFVHMTNSTFMLFQGPAHSGADDYSKWQPGDGRKFTTA